MPWVVSAGLLAGAFDIAYAIGLVLSQGRSPARMLQAIASGVLGKPAFEGGLPIAAFGLACHLAIAVGMAFVYYAAAQRWRFLVEHIVASAAAFGVGSWMAMQYVIVPASAAPFVLPADPASIARSLFAHVVLVGLPIAWIVRRALRG
ncbi:hypothetical protein LYSHEL_21930 [Lysobacter helvus]|uniref:DUF2938 domain-containing protein n=2 Tax=Lysobacteraceae TaxID=32033 RepID=A0ABN6FU82_9GAMM|nr:hypothetical protein LYSCAS_21940 [Lysobacter caseinilyticus]BCT96322.1 hypothetical protein LYSHEL_21930 [Lysobacter helvus]